MVYLATTWRALTQKEERAVVALAALKEGKNAAKAEDDSESSAML